MNGRKENEAKIMKRVEVILSYAPKYVKDYYYSLNDKSYMTKYTYLNYIIDFIGFIGTEYNLNTRDVRCFRKIKTSNINRYINHLEGKSGIKASRFYGIKNFFDFLVNDEYLENNPCTRASVPKDKEEHKITSLTKEEIEIVKENILTGCGKGLATPSKRKWVKRDYAIVMLALSLGFRVTSLTEINIEDINFDLNEIKVVEKGNKVRTVKFSDKIKEVLSEWIFARSFILKGEGISTNALFISNQMKRMSVRSVERLVERYTYNIDKHITPHKLRSTCATNVYNATGDIYLTADILGHSNISNTRRYAQISDERKEKAAAAMDSILF